MFLFVDESGSAQVRLFITLLRVTRTETLIQLKRLARRERKRFQAYLQEIGDLDKEDSIEFLCGATKGEKIPGLVQYPEECIRFFERLARIFAKGKNCQLYVVAWTRNPGQTLPGHRPPDHQPRKRKKSGLSTVRIYTSILGDILSSIRKFPPISDPQKKFRLPKGNRGDRVKEHKIIDKVALLVVDRMLCKRLPRRVFNQRCLAVLKRKKKLRGAWLQVWFNENQNDECLQIVDILSNFFFQSPRLGVRIKKAPKKRAIIKEICPDLGMTRWTPAQWEKAFHILEPSIDNWKTRTWLFRPTRKLRAPSRRKQGWVD